MLLTTTHYVFNFRLLSVFTFVCASFSFAI